MVGAGAVVPNEPVQGYGRAYRRGVVYGQNRQQKPDVVVFIDADYSDYPGEMTALVQPIPDETADLVIGSRVLGNRPHGSMIRTERLGYPI